MELVSISWQAKAIEIIRNGKENNWGIKVIPGPRINSLFSIKISRNNNRRLFCLIEGNAIISSSRKTIQGQQSKKY